MIQTLNQVSFNESSIELFSLSFSQPYKCRLVRSTVKVRHVKRPNGYSCHLHHFSSRHRHRHIKHFQWSQPLLYLLITYFLFAFYFLCWDFHLEHVSLPICIIVALLMAKLCPQLCLIPLKLYLLQVRFDIIAISLCNNSQVVTRHGDRIPNHSPWLINNV